MKRKEEKSGVAERFQVWEEYRYFFTPEIPRVGDGAMIISTCNRRRQRIDHA